MSQQLIKVTEQAKKSETKKAATTKAKKTYKAKPPKDITLEDVKQWISTIEHFEKLNQFLTKFPNAKDEDFVKYQIEQVAKEVSAINFNSTDLKAFFTKTNEVIKPKKEKKAK